VQATSLSSPHHCSQRIRACTSQLGAVRSVVTAHLRLWGCPELADAATLIVTELVANAIRHTHGVGDACGLTMGHDGKEVVFEVTDSCRCRMPEPRAPGPEDDTGRGLMLVAALASDWGVRRGEAGKTVWACLHTAAVEDRPW
jgi:anti-sigma regulatory factor (Ser/Thr protein kinase)